MRLTKTRWLAAGILAMGMAAGPASTQAPAPGQLPALPKGAPKVGDKAPDFALPDTQNRTVRLSELLAGPAPGMAERKGTWVLLVFYRGYW
jgi:hypothetical protein